MNEDAKYTDLTVIYLKIPPCATNGRWGQAYKGEREGMPDELKGPVAVMDTINMIADLDGARVAHFDFENLDLCSSKYISAPAVGEKETTYFIGEDLWTK